MNTTLPETIRAHYLRRSENGLFESITAELPPGTCLCCQGSGWLRVDRPLSDPRFEKLEPCACQDDRELGRLRALSGLKGSELEVRLENLHPEAGPGTQEMLAACKEFVEQ